MNVLEKFQTIQQQGQTTTEEALQLFDELETVDLDFMIGRWKGSGFHTNHPMDGLLETANWYGKEFINPEQVHPLLFLDSNNKIFKVDPNPILMNLALRFPIPKNEAMKSVLTFMNPMMKTEESKARIRMMEHRQKISATMIYDYLPINDIFRKVDESTVLGLMDFKEMQQPFFFVLNRDSL
ncbi:hypothetical protein STA3757_17360 [Stanieria sp. NIES-3757]|nr:hypothetical protein STA3757_17360 [Stanieria sp. NIES-3757]